MPIQTKSFFSKVKIFIFSPKTMDYIYVVHGLNFRSPKNVLRKGSHWKEHLKVNRMVQISALYVAPSSEEL